MHIHPDMTYVTDCASINDYLIITTGILLHFLKFKQ